MKRIVKFLSAVMLGIVAQISTGCVSSDSETEAALEGAWSTDYSSNEDGISMNAQVLEIFSLPEHQFQTEIIMTAGYPLDCHFCTLRYTGTWKASKKAIYQDIDKGSITFSFNNALLDSDDMEEFKNEFLEELKKEGYSEGIRFKSPINDTFEAVDDEGTHFTYTRQF